MRYLIIVGGAALATFLAACDILGQGSGSADTAEQTFTPVDAPPPAEYGGLGTDVVALELEPGLVTIEFTHTGAGNFIVWLSGAERDLLANVIGPWAGTVAVASAGGSYILDIEANDAWTATVRHPRESVPPNEGRRYCAANARWEVDDVFASLVISIFDGVPGLGPSDVTSSKERLVSAGPGGRDVFQELMAIASEQGISVRYDLDQADETLPRLELATSTINQIHIEGEMAGFQCITTTVTPPFELDGLHVLSATHGGNGNFVVWLIDDETGSLQDLAINTVGLTDQMTTVFAPRGRYRLAVEANGEWNVSIPLLDDSP